MSSWSIQIFREPYNARDWSEEGVRCRQRWSPASNVEVDLREHEKMVVGTWVKLRPDELKCVLTENKIKGLVGEIKEGKREPERLKKLRELMG
jgi:hypothetical protein